MRFLQGFLCCTEVIIDAIAQRSMVKSEQDRGGSSPKHRSEGTGVQDAGRAGGGFRSESPICSEANRSPGSWQPNLPEI